MSGVWSNSEVGARNRHVRFPSDSDQTADIAGGPFRATCRHASCWKIAADQARNEQALADTNQQTRPEEQPVDAPHLERPQEIQKILLLVLP